MGVPTKYRMAKDDGKSCATCAYFNPLMSSCQKFITYVDKGATCDSWTMGTKQAEAVVKRATAWIRKHAAVGVYTSRQPSTAPVMPAPPPTDDSVAKSQAAEGSNQAENDRLAQQNVRPIPMAPPAKEKAPVRPLTKPAAAAESRWVTYPKVPGKAPPRHLNWSSNDKTISIEQPIQKETPSVGRLMGEDMWNKTKDIYGATSSAVTGIGNSLIDKVKQVYQDSIKKPVQSTYQKNVVEPLKPLTDLAGEAKSSLRQFTPSTDSQGRPGLAIPNSYDNPKYKELDMGKVDWVRPNDVGAVK